jgi:Ca2+-binding EF-hand superfamily protein
MKGRGRERPGRPPAPPPGTEKPDGPPAPAHDEAEEARHRAEAEALFKKADRDGDGRLTAGEVDRPEVLGRADQDGDGAVTLEEFCAAMKRRARPAPGAPPGGEKGGAGPARGPALSSGALRRFDGNGDGRVGPDEFPGGAEEFRRHDRDGDGFLTEKDLPPRREPPPEKKPVLPEALARQDKNGDGRLDRSEFAGTDDEWRRLDADADGWVTPAEASPAK